jgi:hypothetical protein
MKHIKLFNEKIETDIELDLVKFCDENLAYLIDDGFDFFYYNSSGSDSNASNIPIKVLILFYKEIIPKKYLVGILLRIILYHLFNF